MTMLRKPTRPMSVFWVPLGIFLALGLLPLVLAQEANSHVFNMIVRVMIISIAVLALDLLVGFGGLVSFGHAAFIGLGAYVVGIFGAHGVTEGLITLPVALVVSAIFAALTGAICLRTSGVYFTMITLAFGQMAFFTATSLAPYGGDDGLTIHMRSTIAGAQLFANERNFYYFVLACLLAVYLICRALTSSGFGRVMRGIKENPTRVAALGFDVFLYQFIYYIIAGCIGGLAGFLLANATNFVAPTYMSWQRSAELIIMVLLGGVGTLSGAIVGTASYIFFSEWLSDLTEHWKVIFGPLLVLVVLFGRGGLLGILQRLRQSVS